MSSQSAKSNPSVRRNSLRNIIELDHYSCSVQMNIYISYPTATEVSSPCQQLLQAWTQVTHHNSWWTSHDIITWCLCNCGLNIWSKNYSTMDVIQNLLEQLIRLLLLQNLPHYYFFYSACSRTHRVDWIRAWATDCVLSDDMLPWNIVFSVVLSAEKHNHRWLVQPQSRLV